MCLILNFPGSNGENMEALTGRSIEEKREPNTFAKQFINDLNDHM